MSILKLFVIDIFDKDGGKRYGKLYYMIDIIIIIYSLFCILLAYTFDASASKVLWVMSSPSIFLAGFFPYHFNNGMGIDLLWHDTFELTSITYFWIIVISTSYSFAFMLSNHILSTSLNGSCIKKVFFVERRPLNIAFKFFSVVSILALAFNLIRVGSITSIFNMDGRAYEELFGKYWFVNYAYFMHIPALIMAAIKLYQNQIGFNDKCIAIILVFGSMLHGIKFTFFDAVFIPFLFFVCLYGFDRLKFKFYALLVLFVIFTSSYTLFVRGATEDFNIFYFVNYVIPNYYNLFYALENNPYPLALPIRVLFSLTNFGIEEELLDSGFILNDKYNMSTGYRFLIEGLGIFGVFFFYFSLNFIFNKISNAKIIFVFIKGLILFCYLMMFYSYYVGSKPKIIMLLIVFVFLPLVFKARKYND